MQLHRTEYERNFSVLCLFLATVVCYLNCLSVRSLHTHSDHWQNLLHFFPSLSVKQTQHIPRRLIPSSFTIVVKLIVSKPHPLFPQYICITFRYQPLFLNMTLPFPFPENSGTDVLDDLHKQSNKPETFPHLTSEISCMNCQGHPSN